jgi:hypothetical protein
MTVVDAILKSAAAPIAFNDHEGDLDGGVKILTIIQYICYFYIIKI